MCSIWLQKVKNQEESQCKKEASEKHLQELKGDMAYIETLIQNLEEEDIFMIEMDIEDNILPRLLLIAEGMEQKEMEIHFQQEEIDSVTRDNKELKATVDQEERFIEEDLC